jgi:hypothetical protein
MIEHGGTAGRRGRLRRSVTMIALLATGAGLMFSTSATAQSTPGAPHPLPRTDLPDDWQPTAGTAPDRAAPIDPIASQTRRYQAVQCIDPSAAIAFRAATCVVDGDTGRMWLLREVRQKPDERTELVLWPIGFGIDHWFSEPRKPANSPAPVPQAGSTKLPPGYVLDPPPTAPRHR